MRRVLAGLIATAQILALHAVPDVLAHPRVDRATVEQSSTTNERSGRTRTTVAGPADSPRWAGTVPARTALAQAIPETGSGTAAASDTSLAEPQAKNSKKKWYWIGAGVVVVGLIAALAGGGGSGGDPPVDNTLPAPPGRP